MPRKPAKSGTSENAIVRLVRERFGGQHRSLKTGLGDDAAVIHPFGAKEYWVVTTDSLLEDIHFRTAWMTPEQLGHKSLAVNLSDVAAMGARPRFYTTALAIPRWISKDWIESFYRGMTGLASRYQAVLIGGNLTRSTKSIHISLCLLGETLRRRVILRSGGKPGDFLYVTGRLGRSAAGLRLLESARRKGKTRAEREALQSHREPQPRCEPGLWLALSGYVRAMMDLSDGLSMDLPRMCAESATGAEVYASRLPLFEESRAWHCDPLELGLDGGEDYELLFVVPPGHATVLEKTYPVDYPQITRIGRLTSGSKVVWSADAGKPMQPLAQRGFDHFRI